MQRHTVAFAVAKPRSLLSHAAATRVVAGHVGDAIDRPEAGKVVLFEDHAASAQLRTFLAKYGPELQREARAARRKMRARLPGAFEIVYDNYNFLVFGFSASERPSDCIVSLAAASNGVGLMFTSRIRGRARS